MRTATWIAAMAIAATTATLRLHAETTPPAGGDQVKPEAPKDGQDMARRCEEMKQRMEKHQQMMKQMDDELQQKLDAMEKAQGQAKVDAMADAVKTLIQQRQKMDQARMEMMQHMCKHMGHHMMMKDKMANCPMMQKSEGSAGAMENKAGGQSATPSTPSDSSTGAGSGSSSSVNESK